VPIPRVVRPARALTAVVVAMLLTATAAFTVIEILLALDQRPTSVVGRDRVAEEAVRVTWDEPAVVIVAGVLLFAGVALLTLALVPGRPHDVVLASPNADVAFTISRRAVEQLLRDESSRVDGVTRARVKLRGRTVVVRVTGRIDVNPAAPARLDQALRERVVRLAPVRPAAPTVRLLWKEARR
jgi:hypothetical protein